MMPRDVCTVQAMDQQAVDEMENRVVPVDAFT